MWEAGHWSDRRYARYLIGWGIVVIAEGLILPAIFGPGPGLTLAWFGLGVALLVVGVVLFRTADREDEDDQ